MTEIDSASAFKGTANVSVYYNNGTSLLEDPERAILIQTWDEQDYGNVSLSVEKARTFAHAILTEAAKAEAMMEEAKPKEPTTQEKIRALPKGSIFSTEGYKTRYVKLSRDVAQSIDYVPFGSDKFKPEDWGNLSRIVVHYNPED